MSTPSVQRSGTMFIASPPAIVLMLIEHLPSSGCGSAWTSYRSSSSSTRFIEPIALTPRSGMELWTALPRVVILSQNRPRWAVTTAKSVGSGTMMPASGGSVSRSCMNRTTPALSVSSPAVAAKTMSPCKASCESAISQIAATAVAIPPFHVRGSPAVDLAVLLHGPKRRVPPILFPGADHVEMADEQQGGPPAPRS